MYRTGRTIRVACIGEENILKTLLVNFKKGNSFGMPNIRWHANIKMCLKYLWCLQDSAASG
jgi:hypothetical protein